MAYGEKRDVEPYVFQAVEEEDHPEQKQQVVVARHHVLGAHVDEGQQHDAGAFLDEALVAFRNSVSHRLGHSEEKCSGNE
ncbi:hypothetical protein D3C80_2037050 [compost metagenome]